MRHGREPGMGQAFRELKEQVAGQGRMMWLYSKKPYTIVHLEYTWHGTTLQGVGVAKLSTKDMDTGVAYSVDMGVNIAMGRAAAEIARRIEDDPRYVMATAVEAMGRFGDALRQMMPAQVAS